MALIAVYSPKGGVGKTTLAVNIAWAAATLSSRRTLLWDLDAQAAASFILMPDLAGRRQARAVIERTLSPEALIVPTGVAQLDLLPADASLRMLDTTFAEIDANKRLRRIGEALGKRYERVVIDCPPGIGATTEQLLRGADLLVQPVIPATLSLRAAEELQDQLDQRRKAGPPLLPVFNLVDRRRPAHRRAAEAHPARPAIPASALMEQMAERHAAVGAFAPRSAVAQAVAGLWREIERCLAG